MNGKESGRPPRARYRRFEGKTIRDPKTGEPVNGAILKEPATVFRFQDGRLHGGRDTGGIAVESGNDGYYEKWTRGELKEAGTVMEDGDGKRWKETWEQGKRSGYWENGIRINGGEGNNNEEEE
jgi:hypothetical protein